jgi:hypothetical protein
LVAKESTLARVPVSDLRKVGSLNAGTFMEEISQAGYMKKAAINMPSHISNVYGVTVAEARRLLKAHNFQMTARTTGERDSITEKVAKVING